MARNKGIVSFSGNIESQIASPLDARMVVDTLEDLTSTTTWRAHDNNIYTYIGMLVVVKNDPNPINNGAYYLAASDYTNINNWVKIATNINIPSVEYHQFLAGENLKAGDVLYNIDDKVYKLKSTDLKYHQYNKQLNLDNWKPIRHITDNTFIFYNSITAQVCIAKFDKTKRQFDLYEPIIKPLHHENAFYIGNNRILYLYRIPFDDNTYGCILKINNDLSLTIYDYQIIISPEYEYFNNTGFAFNLEENKIAFIYPGWNEDGPADTYCRIITINNDYSINVFDRSEVFTPPGECEFIHARAVAKIAQDKFLIFANSNWFEGPPNRQYIALVKVEGTSFIRKNLIEIDQSIQLLDITTAASISQTECLAIGRGNISSHTLYGFLININHDNDTISIISTTTYQANGILNTIKNIHFGLFLGALSFNFTAFLIKTPNGIEFKSGFQPINKAYYCINDRFFLTHDNILTEIHVYTDKTILGIAKTDTLANQLVPIVGSGIIQNNNIRGKNVLLNWICDSLLFQENYLESNFAFDSDTLKIGFKLSDNHYYYDIAFLSETLKKIPSITVSNLADSPGSYVDYKHRYLRINATENGIYYSYPNIIDGTLSTNSLGIIKQNIAPLFIFGSDNVDFISAIPLQHNPLNVVHDEAYLIYSNKSIRYVALLKGQLVYESPLFGPGLECQKQLNIKGNIAKIILLKTTNTASYFLIISISENIYYLGVLSLINNYIYYAELTSIAYISGSYEFTLDSIIGFDNKIIITYSSSNTLYARLGIINDYINPEFSWQNPIQISTNSCTIPLITRLTRNTSDTSIRCLIACSSALNAYSVVITISGTNITYGSPNMLGSAATFAYLRTVAYGTTNNTILLITTAPHQLRIATVSGNVVTYGNSLSESYSINDIVVLTNNKIVVLGSQIVGYTISETTITKQTITPRSFSRLYFAGVQLTENKFAVFTSYAEGRRTSCYLSYYYYDPAEINAVLQSNLFRNKVAYSLKVAFLRENTVIVAGLSSSPFSSNKNCFLAIVKVIGNECYVIRETQLRGISTTHNPEVCVTAITDTIFAVAYNDTNSSNIVVRLGKFGYDDSLTLSATFPTITAPTISRLNIDYFLKDNTVILNVTNAGTGALTRLIGNLETLNVTTQGTTNILGGVSIFPMTLSENYVACTYAQSNVLYAALYQWTGTTYSHVGTQSLVNTTLSSDAAFKRIGNNNLMFYSTTAANINYVCRINYNLNNYFNNGRLCTVNGTTIAINSTGIPGRSTIEGSGSGIGMIGLYPGNVMMRLYLGNNYNVVIDCKEIYSPIFIFASCLIDKKRLLIMYTSIISESEQYNGVNYSVIDLTNFDTITQIGDIDGNKIIEGIFEYNELYNPNILVDRKYSSLTMLPTTEPLVHTIIANDEYIKTTNSIETINKSNRNMKLCIINKK